MIFIFSKNNSEKMEFFTEKLIRANNFEKKIKTICSFIIQNMKLKKKEH